MSDASQPSMYGELAEWFHLLTAPEDYAEEAAFYVEQLRQASRRPLRSLLELGSGGGNNAFHYQAQFEQVVLSDLSADMLRLSQTLHPAIEHVHADMRRLRLGRRFDAVFVHDAISYMLSEDDLEQAMATALVHLEPGGVALFAPDHTRENFAAASDTDCGGHDAPDGRGLRYLEWTTDPDPNDTTYVVDYAFLVREPGQPRRVVKDQHTCGLFNRATWLRLLAGAGFEQPRSVPFEHSEEPSGALEVFVATAPDGAL